jgi:predicted ABC-type ATPase
MKADRRGRIRVLAGVNGAGKSSIIGASIRAAGGNYFNPDEIARRLLAEYPHLAQADANAKAWAAGRDGLEAAIKEHGVFSFETTLGGHSIVQLLEQALTAGVRVEMRYVGLDSVERHIARVKARVSVGGHDIPSLKIRERYDGSRANLIRILPRLTHLVVYDNSEEGSPELGLTPAPSRLIEMHEGRIVYIAPRADIPTWAEQIAAAAIISHRAGGVAANAPRRKTPPP